MRTIILYFLLFICLSANSQNLNITVEQDRFGIDHTRKIIVSQLFDIENYKDLSGYQKLEITFDSIAFLFETVPDGIAYDSSYLVKKDSDEFRLFFTELPIVLLNTSEPIVNEPKTPVDFVYSDKNQIIKETPGIEIRGGFSQTFPKKTYDLEFWKDGDPDDKTDVQFGDLRNDDDWILDALYNEPLRIRTYIAHNLWLKTHTLYYADEEPKAKSGADVFFVEVFLDEKYNGIYLLSEQVDRKLLQLKKYDDEIRGELYKGIDWVGGATVYSNLPALDNNSRFWGGYEVKYPMEDDTTDWKSLYELTDFVINASDADFKSEIWSKIHFENFRDYFIYLNLIRARDNTGKNLFMAKYDKDEPFICSPWDLDACFGTLWDGTNDTKTDNLLSNGLYDRLLSLNPSGFKGHLFYRWSELRAGIFSDDELQNLILNAYQILTDNNIYARERYVYPNYPFDQSSVDYTLSWTKDRIEFLDEYFGNFEGVAVQTLPNPPKTVFFPNPNTGILKIKNIGSLNRKPYLITDSFGIIQASGILEKGNFIDISKLPAGLYILKTEALIFKILKQNSQ